MRTLGCAVAVAVVASLFATSVSGQVTWTTSGPGGGGWLTAITVVDDAAHTVYVGCDVGGIYKSTDNGRTWQIKNAGISTYYVQDIAYDPALPSTLYVATRGGVFKSTDGGDNWVPKRSGFPPEDEFSFSAPVSDIVVDPAHRNIIYAGIGVPRTGYELDSYHWETAGVKGAIYKSTDFGESWTLFRGTGIDTTAMVYTLALEPGDSSTIYAATSEGVYRSTDAGQTWLPKSSGLPQPLAMTLAIDPDDTAVLYVTLWAEPGSATWQGGVYKSVDSGDSWTAMNNGLPQVMGAEAGLTANYPTILIDRHNPQTLYVGNRPWTPDPGIYKTSDGGANWAWVSRDEPPVANVDLGWIDQHGLFVTCMAIDPAVSDRLYFGTSTHLFQTENAGAYWSQVYSDSVGAGYWRGNGLETTVVQEIVVDPTESDNIYVGFWDMGFLKSVDGGLSFKRTWQGMTYDANTFAIVVDPVDPRVVYAATGWWETNEGEVCRSTDHGETWTVVSNGLPDAQVWSLALDKTSPTDSRILYATSYDHGVFKTTDGGQDWIKVSTGLGVAGNLQLREIVVDPNDPAVLYAGIEAKHIESGSDLQTVQGGLFKSTDAGLNWTRLDAALPQASVWDIVVDPENSQIIYTAVGEEYDHTLQTTFPGGVYKSTDGGATWTVHNSGFGDLDNLEVLSVALSPVDSGILYAVTSDAPYHDRSSGRGIFKSTDAGATWAAINDGLGVLNFDVIAIDPSLPSRLYAGSGGNGIARGVDHDLPGSGVDDVPAGRVQLLQNTPNPFNPRTTISFVLSSRQDVDLGVYSVRGRLLRMLLHDRRTAGTHTVVWNGRDDQGNLVASGVYFYRLRTDLGSSIRKMTLLK